MTVSYTHLDVYKRQGPQLTALMGGHIDIMISNASEIFPQAEAKTIRVIAVGSEKKIDLYPSVLTYKESGFDYVQVSMRGLAAPKGMDPKQIKILSDAMKKSFDDPEFRKHAPVSYTHLDVYKRQALLGRKRLITATRVPR